MRLWSGGGSGFAGQVLALKGLGGFHLIVDATNEAAVQTLRQRKHRPTKPLAVMFPSLDSVKAHCQVSQRPPTCCNLRLRRLCCCRVALTPSPSPNLGEGSKTGGGSVF
jgi:hypothetical protein